jgi:hypothetical protein
MSKTTIYTLEGSPPTILRELYVDGLRHDIYKIMVVLIGADWLTDDQKAKVKEVFYGDKKA